MWFKIEELNFIKNNYKKTCFLFKNVVPLYKIKIFITKWGNPQQKETMRTINMHSISISNWRRNSHTNESAVSVNYFNEN